eukprot:1171439-Pleurochrysis_carterae.AAC.1
MRACTCVRAVALQHASERARSRGDAKIAVIAAAATVTRRSRCNLESISQNISLGAGRAARCSRN